MSIVKAEFGRYVKKPVVIEAMQYTGKTMNVWDIICWAHNGRAPEANAIIINRDTHLTIRTLEGDMVASVGDWIIRGVKGEFYPCKPDVFAATYGPVVEAPDILDRPRDAGAVRDAALEEAAAQCEDIYSWPGAVGAGVMYRGTQAACAAAIRALKSGPHQLNLDLQERD